MVESVSKQKELIGSQVKDLSPEDRQKLVSVFAWLMQEDKKQNPALYKAVKRKSYD